MKMNSGINYGEKWTKNIYIKQLWLEVKWLEGDALKFEIMNDDHLVSGNWIWFQDVILHFTGY